MNAERKATRGDFVRAIVERTGKTEAQAEAFLDILSAVGGRTGSHCHRKTSSEG